MREIELKDREQVERIRKACGHELSSHAFPSIFLWREKLGLQIELEEDGYLVQSTRGEEKSYYYPCGSGEAQLCLIREHIKDPGFTLDYIREGDKEFLEAQFPGAFALEEVPEAEEYIFDRAGFMSLKGAAYANVRKRLNRLFREHRIEARPFREEDAAAVAALIEGYHTEQHQTGQYGLVDDLIPQQAFKLRRELELVSVVVFVDGELKGAAFGFPLNEETIDGCVECHDPTIEGMSVYTQMAMLLEAPENFRYMNAEEDLGIPGLRRMKQYMNPCRMNRIYRAKVVVGHAEEGQAELIFE